MEDLILSGTGHRPDKLGGYGDEPRVLLVNYLIDVLPRHRPTQIISGMALGFDTALALALTLRTSLDWKDLSPTSQLMLQSAGVSNEGIWE